MKIPIGSALFAASQVYLLISALLSFLGTRVRTLSIVIASSLAAVIGLANMLVPSSAPVPLFIAAPATVFAFFVLFNALQQRSDDSRHHKATSARAGEGPLHVPSDWALYDGPRTREANARITACVTEVLRRLRALTPPADTQRIVSEFRAHVEPLLKKYGDCGATDSEPRALLADVLRLLALELGADAATVYDAARYHPTPEEFDAWLRDHPAMQEEIARERNDH